MMMGLVSSYLVSNRLLLQVSEKETNAGQTQQTLQKSSVGSFKVVGPWLWNSLPFANQCSGTVPSSIKSLNTKTRILLTVTMQSWSVNYLFVYIHIFPLNAEVEDVLCFIARDLTFLPPLSQDHFDHIAVMRDVVQMCNNISPGKRGHSGWMTDFVCICFGLV